MKTAFAALLLLMAGCAVGPDYQKPAAPTVATYTQNPISTTTGTTNIAGGDAQQFVTAKNIPAEWWELFHSPPLSQCIKRALTNNPDIGAAQAALAAARENVLAQRGSYYPSVSGSFSAARQKTSAQIAPVPNNNDLYYSLFTPQVSVSYTPDVFGLNRRTVESLNAQAGQARFAWAATYVTLSANVAAAAIQEASLQAQVDTTRELISINTNLLQILHNQFGAGYASRLDVAAQESQVAQTTATLPPLLKQLAQQKDLLAALTGGFPGDGPSAEFDLSSLQLPQELPLTIPSRLVEQRPDVRQAEENLHAACAQVGIAAANRLPNITLTADAGTMALEAGQMFASGAGFWTLAGSVTQPIFDGGQLMHKERAARDAYIQAREQYRSAVLNAFQNVADTLNALEQDADALKAAAAAADAARVSLDLTNRQMEAGSMNTVAFLNAEQAYQQAALNLIQARASRYADTVALFQALGGGWWNRVEFSKN